MVSEGEGEVVDVARYLGRGIDLVAVVLLERMSENDRFPGTSATPSITPSNLSIFCQNRLSGNLLSEKRAFSPVLTFRWPGLRLRPRTERCHTVPRGRLTSPRHPRSSATRRMVCPHPFVLDVRPVRYLAGRFAYSITEAGKPRVHSLHTFSSFDEPRMAGKAALDQMIAQWLEREVEAT